MAALRRVWERHPTSLRVKELFETCARIAPVAGETFPAYCFGFFI